MTDLPELPRWAEPDAGAPAELSRLLQRGRAELGSQQQVDELARRLSAALGPAAGLPEPRPAAEPEVAPHGPPESDSSASGPRASETATRRAGGTLSSGGARVLLSAVAGVAAIAGSWALLSPGPSAPAAPEVAPTPVVAPAPVSPAPVAPAEPRAPPAPAPRDVAEPPAPAPRVSEPKVSEPAPRRRRAPQVARGVRPGAEAQLLERAQVALGRDPAEALRLTREHEARFARGALVQEREVIAIEALERLGRGSAARARAAAFERRFPGSVHHPRVRRATDTSAPSGGAPSTLPP